MSADLAAVGGDTFVDLVRALPTCVYITDEHARPVYCNLSALEHFGPMEAIEGVPSLFEAPHDAMLRARFDDPDPQKRAMVTRIVNGRMRIYGAYTLNVNDRGTARIALFLHEITESHRARREAEALATVAAATAFAGTLESTMDALAHAVVRATGSDACSVVLFESDPFRMRFIGSSGLPAQYGDEFEQLWRDQRPVFDAEEYLQGGNRVTRGVRREMLESPYWAIMHPLLRGATWESMASTMLSFHGRLLGALTCYYAAGRAMADDDETFLQAIADQAAVAVENARLFLEVQQKAVLEERQRLARELHDSVSQALYGIGLGARTALVQLDRDATKAREPVEYVLSLAEGGLAEMRALIFELRPDDLDREGLVAAFRRHTVALRARHGLIVDEDMIAEPDMSPATRLALYRIGQEALHNVVRHAQSKAVSVRLALDGDAVTLEVRDDGVGFETNRYFTGHFGLRSMRERAERLGGSLQVESTPGQGTRLVARIPALTAG